MVKYRPDNYISEISKRQFIHNLITSLVINFSPKGCQQILLIRQSFTQSILKYRALGIVCAVFEQCVGLIICNQ